MALCIFFSIYLYAGRSTEELLIAIHPEIMKNEDIKILFYFLKAPRDRITDILYFNLVCFGKKCKKKHFKFYNFRKI